MTVRAPAQAARAGESYRSPASPQLMACATCGRAALEGYPHRHSTPLRPDYDPMPRRPEHLYCGLVDVNRYWTGSGARPDCCMVHLIAHEVRAEVPGALHPVRLSVSTRAEPIPDHPGDPSSPTTLVSDCGPLGGWPWSRMAQRRLGGVTRRGDRDTLNAWDYAAFPWAYVIGPRLAGYCRALHVQQEARWPEHRGQPICSPLVRLVVERGYRPADVAERSGIEADRLTVLLSSALSWAWLRVSEAVNDLDLRRIARPA